MPSRLIAELCTGEFGCLCALRRTGALARMSNLLGHGTKGKYMKGCRCPVCRKANARYMREYRARVKERS